MEKQFAKEWGLGESEEDEDEEDQESLEENEEDDAEDLEQYFLEDLYCVACDKEFKNKKAWVSLSVVESNVLNVAPN